MTRKPRFLILAILLAASSLTAAQARPAFGKDAGERADPAEATLDRLRSQLPHSGVHRPEEIVVVKGGLDSLLGAEAPIEELRVMAFLPHTDWVVIPFQIDERDTGGEWLSGDMPGAKPPAGAGVLSDRDEMVFRARDLGVRAARPAWPEGAADGAEIEVVDPRAGGSGWAYLFRFPSPPPLAPGDSVRYYTTSAAVGDSVLTPFYRVFYPRRRGRFAPATMTELAIDGAGRGKHGADLLDRGKVRYEGRLRFLPFGSFRRDETGFIERSLGHIDGPLRALRAVERRFHLAGAPDPKVEGMTTFLPERIIIDGPARVPSGLRYIARQLDVRMSWDFLAPPGSTVHAAPVPLGVPAGRASDEIGNALDGVPGTWWALVTPGNGAILAIYEPPGSGGRIGGAEAKLFYRDNGAPDPPEEKTGSLPDIGWRLPGERSEAKRPARIHLIVLPEFRPGDEKLRLQRLRYPLVVKTRKGLAH